jgi:hypothetical protein
MEARNGDLMDLTIGGQEITGKRLPEDEFGLCFLLAAFSAIIVCVAVVGTFMGIREEKEAYGSCQHQEKKP